MAKTKNDDLIGKASIWTWTKGGQGQFFIEIVLFLKEKSREKAKSEGLIGIMDKESMSLS